MLDQGFIKVIDYMSEDSLIVQSARVYYEKGKKKFQQMTGKLNFFLFKFL